MAVGHELFLPGRIVNEQRIRIAAYRLATLLNDTLGQPQ